jgi:Phospholipase_D-nuclease N-terminal
MDLTSYPFLHVMWSMFLFFVFFAWIWVVVSVFIDNFRRTDHSGVAKAVWTVVIIFLPIIGVLFYMISRPAVAVVD